MLDVVIAAALMQAAPDPCHAVEPAGALPAGCPRWQSFFTGPVGELAFDPDSVRRSGDMVEIRTRGVLPGDGPHRIRSLVATQIYDCVRRTVAHRRLTSFDASGTPLNDGTPAPSIAGPAPVRPGTPHVILLTRFCPRRGE